MLIFVILKLLFNKSFSEYEKNFTTKSYVPRGDRF